MTLNGEMALIIISPSQRDLDYILVAWTTQSRDTITIPLKVTYLPLSRT